MTHVPVPWSWRVQLWPAATALWRTEIISQVYHFHVSSSRATLPCLQFGISTRNTSTPAWAGPRLDTVVPLMRQKWHKSHKQGQAEGKDLKRQQETQETQEETFPVQLEHH